MAITDSRRTKWPAVEQREAIIRDGGELADLWELSNPRIDDQETHTEQIIDRLFPDNALLCCGFSNSDFDTRLRSEWRGHLSALQLIVPSPMTARRGLTKDGTESAHALSITGARWFLICEFDQGDPDDHAALLIHLGGYAPLVCASTVAARVCKAGFLFTASLTKRCCGFRYAVSLGADPATWTRCQFVRMPDGLRDNGKRQTVFFVNFKSLEMTP